MGERLANIGLSERLLGLDQRLIDRLQPLSNYEVSSYPPEIPAWVAINWFEPDGSGSNSGKIKIFFSKEVAIDGSLKDFSPNMLASTFYPLGQEKSGPFNALSAVLTIMAAVDNTARVLKEDFLHVVRANKKARPYFQRFREVGLYHHCDTRGRRKQGPVVINGHELYVCRYPVEGIDSVIGKFVVDEAVREIIRMREEGRKDYHPRSLRSFIRSLVSG